MKIAAIVLIIATVGEVLGHSVRLAPLMAVGDDMADLVLPNEYIVKLREPDSLASDFSLRREQTARDILVNDHLERLFGQSLLQADRVIHRYNLGYAAVLDQATVAQLRVMPEVDYIEPNQIVWAMRDNAADSTKTQLNPPNWGLDRIARRDLPLGNEYTYAANGGLGVDVYIIDTGIHTAHQDFGGRAVWGLTAPKGDEDIDGNGHGTHVASTIAGTVHGVAKNATVIAVKVLRTSGYGTMADVLKGVEWAVQEHQRKSSKAGGRPVKSVANMSLGGGKSYALDAAVESAVESGVLFAVAAGNDNRDACKYSPAGATAAITVGATDRYDSRAYFSNWGMCVDIFAPGHQITAAWIGATDAVRTISGTSMASPHVAGVMALLAAEADYTAAELKAKVLSLATENKVVDAGLKSPNKLLFVAPHNEAEVPVEAAVRQALRFQL